jgi:hypothetical protein
LNATQIVADFSRMIAGKADSSRRAGTVKPPTSQLEKSLLYTFVETSTSSASAPNVVDAGGVSPQFCDGER